MADSGMVLQLQVDVERLRRLELDVFASVKQGCIIAPSLFSLFFAAMLEEATEDMPQGVTIRFRNGSIFILSRLKASTQVRGPHQRAAIC